MRDKGMKNRGFTAEYGKSFIFSVVRVMRVFGNLRIFALGNDNHHIIITISTKNKYKKYVY